MSLTLLASPASGTQLGNTYYAVDGPTCTPAGLGSCSVYSGPIAITTEGTHSLTFFSISYTATDSDSGVQDSMPTTSPLVINGEGMGLQVPVQATNYADLSTGVLSPPVNIDRTPPTTTARLSPGLNPRGWANRPVTVTLSATDSLSGVEHTEASLDGGA